MRTNGYEVNIYKLVSAPSSGTELHKNPHDLLSDKSTLYTLSLVLIFVFFYPSPGTTS